MDTARIIPRPVLRFSAPRIDTHRFKLPSLNDLGIGNSRVSFRGEGYNGILNSEFSDSGHLKYYVSPARCGGKKGKNKEIKTEKKKLKLMKRLSRDLPIFSHTVSCEDGCRRLIGEAKEKMISEATEILLAELQNLRLEQKEQKRERKEGRATLINTRLKCDSGSSSSSSSSSNSSSSESSDSDCGEVVSVKQLRSSALNQLIETESADANQDHYGEIVLGINDSSPPNLREAYNERSNSVVRSDNRSNGARMGASGRKVEICMGSKCKKLGATALLEEFEMKIGKEGAVVGCKCLGKCKNGPNVRVFDFPSEAEDVRVEDSVKPSLSPLCIGVGLEDVGIIVTRLLDNGKDRNLTCLLSPS